MSSRYQQPAYQQFTSNRLPPARPNKNLIVQVTDYDGQLWKSDGDTWAPITEQLKPGTQVVEAVVTPAGGLRFSGRANAEIIKGKIGRVPLRVSGIGNSIMASYYAWWRQCCAASNGALVEHDDGHGVGGNNTAQMVARMAEVPLAADIVVIMEGTNDGEYNSRADHILNMRTLIEFYLDRGQLPILCFPPPRGDDDTKKARSFALGMIDYWLAQGYGIPCVQPWRQFVDESTGAPTAAFGAVDAKHPGATAHYLAGVDMWQQLSGQSSVSMLSLTNHTYGGIALLDDSLFATGWGTFGAGGSSSLVADAAIPGGWQKLTGSGAGTFTGYKNALTGFVAGDEIVVSLRRKSGGTAGGYGQTGVYVDPIGNRGPYAMLYGDSNGVIEGSFIVPAGANYLQGNISTVGAANGLYVQAAQFQMWNKTAIMERLF